jgi:hydrogenase maturation protease
MKENIKVLVYGYGNPGRQDDALGNEMVNKIAEWVEKHQIKNVEVDSNYQLNIEDAERISAKDIVIFVDATQEEEIHEYKFTHLDSSEEKVEFTMHSVSPEYVLHVCQDLFKKSPRTCLMAIRGYEWDFREGLTDSAKLNLEQAFQFLTRKLEAYIDTDIHYPISML